MPDEYVMRCGQNTGYITRRMGPWSETIPLDTEKLLQAIVEAVGPALVYQIIKTNYDSERERVLSPTQR